MVIGGDSRSKGCGFESRPGYWMDMTFFKLICCKHCIVCLKRPKINEKEAVVGPFFFKKSKQVGRSFSHFVQTRTFDIPVND